MLWPGESRHSVSKGNGKYTELFEQDQNSKYDMTPINRYKRALHMAKEVQAYNSPSRQV